MSGALSALGLSLLAYLAGLWIQRHTGNKPYMHPVILAILLVAFVLALLDESATDAYLEHNMLLLDLLMVAVVAFSVPLVDNMRLVLREFARLLAVVALAAIFIAGSTIALCYAFGIDAAAMAAFSFRSVTNPIAIAIAEQNALSVDLAMLGVSITGVVGILTAEHILAALRITDPRHVGLVLGITSHAFGIARALEISSLAAAYATVGMIVSGLLYAFAVPWLLRFVPL